MGMEDTTTILFDELNRIRQVSRMLAYRILHTKLTKDQHREIMFIKTRLMFEESYIMNKLNPNQPQKACIPIKKLQKLCI
jgi:hypothetical protein